jgi:hypothetical protein
MDNLTPESIGTAIVGIVAMCSAISAFVPSVGKIMKVVDALALNWNKARNDSRVQ